VTLRLVRGRVFVGVGAWLAGAAAATGFSHLAVSLLGRGIASDSGQSMSSQAVRQALNDARQAAVSASPSAAAPGVWSSAAPASARGEDRSIVLASGGGTVVARCSAGGAYLKSWSPAQGFMVDSFARGPAAAAHVTFESSGRSITMRISCLSGTAKVNLSYQRTGWSTNDTGEPNDH
jgi:hypothetical protein